MTRSSSNPRGATLIELMVALAILAVVLSVTVGLIVGAIRSAGRTRARSELGRHGELLGTMLGDELRMTGLGVPASGGRHIDVTYAGGETVATNGGNGNQQGEYQGDFQDNGNGTAQAGVRFESAVILAIPDAVGVIGDFPRADAQYNALGVLENRPAGGRSNIMWHTENNGRCAPDTGGASCTTASASPFFPGEQGCNALGHAGDRTCPWGMRRIVAGERIQVIGGNQRWTNAGVASPLAVSALGGGLVSLNLVTAWNAVWPNAAAGDMPVSISGQGYVTTIDRVFFRKNGSNLERIQCSGDPDPRNVNWPNLATNAMPAIAALAITPVGGVQNTCVGPEVIAKNVQSVAFSYFDAAGAATASKDLVRRIDWVIKLRRTVNSRSVDQDVVGSASFRNL